MSTSADPASAIVAALASAGTRLVFGIPGGGPNLDVVGAAAAAGLRFVLARGETAATIMDGGEGRGPGAGRLPRGHGPDPGARPDADPCPAPAGPSTQLPTNKEHAQ